MPKLSPTIEEGTLIQWHFKEGEYIEEGKLLIEVATDKATIEHHAIDEGWLRKILVSDGEVAQVNKNLAIFTEEEKERILEKNPKAEIHVRKKILN